MDSIGLQILRSEMSNDCRVCAVALQKPVARFERRDEIGYEACAHHLARMYNAFEQMGLRIPKAFENNIDDDQGWHSALLNRLSISITGVRPPFVPDAIQGTGIRLGASGCVRASGRSSPLQLECSS